MVSTHVGELDMPLLPIAARRAHILPALSDQSLISIRQMCDSFTAASVTVTHDDTIVFTGTQNTTTKLWTLTAPTIEISNAAVGAPSPAALVAYAHAG
jgi:hypothetical protein